MDDLVIHAITEKQLRNFGGHALLLVGPEGIGKYALATSVAQAVLGIESQNELGKYPYARFIAPEESGSISIDAVRALLPFAKLKIAGQPTNKPRRVIIIERAHAMTQEAQNALLKLLEEPPANTLFILTATSDQRLLPTIRSRVQIISVQRPTEKTVSEYFASKGPEAAKIHQAYLMSGGLPGLMHALLTDAEHPLTHAVVQARALLRASQFERLASVDALAKEKANCLRTLSVLQQMAQAALEQTATKEESIANVRVLRQWHRVLAASFAAETALAGNAQPKLALTNFMLAL